MGKLKKILWSLDAFEEKSEMRNHVVGAVKYLLHKSPAAKVEPVYVLSPAELEVSVDFSAPWVKQLKPAAERAVRDIVASVQLGEKVQPTVLVQRNPSITHSVQTLLKYAKSTRADLIVAGTHARQGVSRLLLGSYAETLLLQSKTPVLVVGPESQVLHRNHILFVSDLDPVARQAFKKVLALAQDLGARLTILHCVPHPVEAVVETGVFLQGGWIPVREYLAQDEARKCKLGEKWVAEARSAGVQAQFVVDRGSAGGSVTESILASAQSREAGMIAMAALSGPIAAALLGSVTRQVVRRAPCPVWIWRPER